VKKADEKKTADERCAKCGACTAVCPVYRISGKESHTARGRLHLLSRLINPSSTTFGEITSACLLCGACRDVCARKIDTLSPLIKAREHLPTSAQYHYVEKLIARKTLASPFLLRSFAKLRAGLIEHLPKSSGLRMKLAILPDDFLPTSLSFSRHSTTKNINKPKINYFSGCLARYLQRDIITATDFLTEQATGSPLLIPDDQTCCGLASFAAGSRKEAQELARTNIAAFAVNDLPILTSCASCYSHLRSYPELLADNPQWRKRAIEFAARLREFSSFFLEKCFVRSLMYPIKLNSAIPRVFYHDPCHLRFGPEKIIAQPRALLKKILGVPPLEPARGTHCCGQGGLFQLAHGELSRKIFTEALQDFSELSATHIVSTCSGCLLQWQKGVQEAGLNSQTCHLSVLLAKIIYANETA